MTPDLIFGIAIAIITLFVLCALIEKYLSNTGNAGNVIPALFILICVLILISATFFAEHIKITNAENKTKQYQELK